MVRLRQAGCQSATCAPQRHQIDELVEERGYLLHSCLQACLLACRPLQTYIFFRMMMHVSHGTCEVAVRREIRNERQL